MLVIKLKLYDTSDLKVTEDTMTSCIGCDSEALRSPANVCLLE